MWPLLTLSRCKYCPTQLSANKFVPWMLTAFIHSLPPAVFFGCYTATRTNNPPWPLEGIYWTYWHWLIVWTLILTPQFVVLAAFIRVHRFDPNLNSVQVYQPMDLNDASASGWTMKEDRMSLPASFWRIFHLPTLLCNLPTLLSKCIPDICHRHHRRCLCKFFPPRVIFVQIERKNITQCMQCNTVYNLVHCV